MPILWCSDDMIRVVQLHRDGMPVCVAAQCADVLRETLRRRLKQGIIQCDRMDNSEIVLCELDHLAVHAYLPV